MSIISQWREKRRAKKLAAKTDARNNIISRTLRRYALGYMIFLYAPMIFIPLFSFNTGAVVAFPIEGLGLKWYIQLFQTPEVARALINSLMVAIPGSLISTGIAILACRALTRHRLPFKNALTAPIMLPLFLPDIMMGLSILQVVNQFRNAIAPSLPASWQAVFADYFPSLLTVALGHVLILLPFAMTVLLSAFEGLDQSLEEASSDLGENDWQTFRRIILPLVMPGILSSLILCFIVSFDEFIIAFFASGTENTLPLYLWSQLRFIQKLPHILALGSLILLSSVILIS
ncbi:MAG: ABC transporter permease, partial [Alphaproteobacteria bacterium]|nr:ABC transporter permease [Alphaproteobacteria bacterium]